MKKIEWVLENKSDEIRDGLFCELAYLSKFGHPCKGEKCTDCPFDANTKEAVKELLEEHKEKIPLKQIEYDLIVALIEFSKHGDLVLERTIILDPLFRKGHFKGVKNKRMKLTEIINNSLIVSDDYDFGGNKNE